MDFSAIIASDVPIPRRNPTFALSIIKVILLDRMASNILSNESSSVIGLKGLSLSISPFQFWIFGISIMSPSELSSGNIPDCRQSLRSFSHTLT